MLDVDELSEQEGEAVPLAVKATGIVGHETVRPDGATSELRAMDPTKFCRLVRVTGIDEVVPTVKLTAPGTTIAKSPTWETNAAL